MSVWGDGEIWQGRVFLGYDFDFVSTYLGVLFSFTAFEQRLVFL